MSMTVKKGDNVVVITGKDKGKTGKVLEVFPKDNKVLVDGVNIVTKHKKARTQQEKSEIVKKAAPFELQMYWLYVQFVEKLQELLIKKSTEKMQEFAKNVLHLWIKNLLNQQRKKQRRTFLLQK